VTNDEAMINDDLIFDVFVKYSLHKMREEGG